MTKEVGLRRITKAMELPPNPTVRAPMFYPTEPHEKGVANRFNPESCADHGNIDELDVVR